MQPETVIADNCVQHIYRYPTMRPPITLAFRHLDRSGALEDRARRLGSRLERYNGRITQCHMTLEGPDTRSDTQAPYLAKIDLIVPGAQIHADSLHVDGTGHKDIYLALRDAFNNAKRQLQELQRDPSGAAQRMVRFQS
jgi:ribosome-associated translation inhibitor RaiA